MKTGATLFVVVIALAAGGFAGYRLAQPKTDAAAPSVAVDSKKTAKKQQKNMLGMTGPLLKARPVPFIFFISNLIIDRF